MEEQQFISLATQELVAYSTYTPNQLKPAIFSRIYHISERGEIKRDHYNGDFQSDKQNGIGLY